MAKPKTNRRRKRRRKIIATVLIVLAVVIAGGGFGVYRYMKSKIARVKTHNLDKGKVVKSEVSEETKKILSGYTTIALFGLDNRHTGNYDRGNSDVIMILNINNDTKEMQVVSVYRDTYLNVQGESDRFFKANAAYGWGGPEQAISMLNVNLDLDIDNYITFDFETVADAIDEVGGVDIEIESEEELGYLNKYISHTNRILDRNAKHIDHTGLQTLDGVQSVAYGRIRYTSGSDFRRAERHRLVLSQLIKKVKKANLNQLNHLLDTVLPEIQTDLPEKNLVEMVTVMMDYDLKDSRGFPFQKDSTKLSNSMGGWVDVPCDLVTNVSELHEYLFGEKDYEPSSKIGEYNETIIANTGLSKENAYEDSYSDVDAFDGNGGRIDEEELEKLNQEESGESGSESDGNGEE